MSYNCEIFDQKDQLILIIRTHAAVEKLPQVLGEAYGKIAQYLGEIGEQPGGAPFTAYYNMDMQNLDLAIGFPVEKPLAGRGDIQSDVMPAGKYVSCLHKGPYDKTGAAYEALSAFLAENNLQASGLAYEFYLNDPNEVMSEELKTQIVFPLVAE